MSLWRLYSPAAWLLTGLVCGLPPASVGAQEYPSKSVKIIVPLNPGSPVDAAARVVAQYLQAQMAQSFVIENRPGAGTTIGTKAVATAERDGYTLLFAGSSIAGVPFLYPSLNFDLLMSFTPVVPVASWSHIVGIAPSVPAKTVVEFVSHAKANPGKLIFGFGLGTAPHILGATLKEATGIDITFLSYRGGEQARMDLLGGRVHINIAPGATLLPVIQEGKVRALAVTGAARHPELPDVPTMIESGYPSVGYYPDAWVGLLAPFGTPPTVIATLHREVARALKAPEVVAALVRMGFEPMVMSQQAYAAFFADELTKWPPRLQAAGLKPL